MTPTEQAADRVKALAEAKLAAPYEPGKMQSSAWYKATREFHEGITPEVLLDLLSALTALQARVEEAERENERLSARNLEVSTLAHGWMVAHDNRAAGLPVTYPSPADVPASLFLLALMAAAAESTRYDLDEAEDRIEELEKDAEIVSAEFEGDCWKAVRSLLERVGWTDFSEGVTADAACKIIGDAIRESSSWASTLQARVGELEGELSLLEEVCARYADDEDDYLDGDGDPFGSITTECGMKARSARKRFRARALLTPPLEQE